MDKRFLMFRRFPRPAQARNLLPGEGVFQLFYKKINSKQIGSPVQMGGVAADFRPPSNLSRQKIIHNCQIYFAGGGRNLVC